MTTTERSESAGQGRVDDLTRAIAEKEREQAEAEGSLAELTGRIEAGEDVGPDAIPERHRVIEHLRTVLSGLRKRRETARGGARLERLQQLRAEIEEGVSAAGDPLVDLVAAAQEAQAAVLTAVRERQERVHRWAARMNAEDVPRYTGSYPEPSPAHAGLASNLHALAVGDLRIRTDLDGDSLVRVIQRNAERLATGRPAEELEPVRTGHRQPALSPAARYFRSGHGAGPVEVVHDGHVPDAFRSAASDVREITEAEAIAYWHGAGDAGQAVSLDEHRAARQAGQ